LNQSRTSESGGGTGDGVAVPELPSLPCLLLTTAPAGILINRSAVAKKAETLYVNLESLINRVGIERVGFVTLTFPDNCSDRDEAQSRFHSFSTHVLRPKRLEFIAVPERQSRGAFHYHLATAFPWDIRTGFDFAACRDAVAAKRRGDFGEFKRLERIYFQSANKPLRNWWAYLRKVSPRYQFGRCETLPILSNAAALSRYLGAYVSTASGARLPCDKGLRTVRYSLNQRAATLRWSWANGNGAKWRRGLQILGTILERDMDGLKNLYGKKFQYVMRRIIFVLGESFDKALFLCSKIPEWADHGSRVRFLSALVNTLQKDFVLDVQLLEQQIDQPF
jgi:hypothetical protein